MMDKVGKDISDMMQKVEICKVIFCLAVLLLAGWFLAGPMLNALERNDYEKPKVVQI